jgi:hypothetical protein
MDIIDKAIQTVMNTNFIQPIKKTDINEEFQSVSSALPITEPSSFNYNIRDGFDASGNYTPPKDKGQFLKQFNQDFDDYKKKVKENYKDGIKKKEETIYNYSTQSNDNYVLLSMGIIMIVIGIIYLIFAEDKKTK